jgi:hypothetical protein
LPRGTAARRRSGILDPDRTIRKAQDNLVVACTVEHRLALADALMNQERFDEAHALYVRCLLPAHAHDPEIMQKLARASFASNDVLNAHRHLEDLFVHNPHFQSSEGRLLGTVKLPARTKSKARHSFALVQQAHVTCNHVSYDLDRSNR